MSKRNYHPLIQEYLDALSNLKKAQVREQRAMKAAVKGVRMPTQLRPATPADIKEGAVIWYPHHTEPTFLLVWEVWNPQSEYNGYMDVGGDNYGLKGAHVEVTKQK